MKHEEHSDQGNIFVAFIGAGCNKWLWDDKITRFNVFVRGGCGVDENIWKFAGGGYQNQTSTNKWRGGVQFLVILW